MGDLRIDISELKSFATEFRTKAGRRRRKRRRRRRAPESPLVRLAKLVGAAAALAVLPFFVLIRGGVFAYQMFGIGTWPALLLAAGATAVLLGAYAWAASARLGAGDEVRRLVSRAAAGVAVAWVVYALVFVAGANVKSDAVRADYRAMHPLLRMASSALVLFDSGSVITDAGRTPDDYRRMGLPAREASLHFEQADGWVHALDLRTNGRWELRNFAVAMTFRALGFGTLRHVGTADHLHVSLGLPR
jgi:hypothetical protein